MNASVSVKFSSGDTQRWLNVTPANVRTAARQTIRQIVNEAHKELASDIPKRAGISITGFRRIRAKKNRPKGRGRIIRGSVWMGRNEVEARRAGKPKQFDGYVKAGKYLFDKSFVMRVRNRGKDTNKSSEVFLVYRRIAGELVKQNISLPDAPAQARGVFAAKRGKLESVMTKKIQIQLDKKLAKGR